MKLALTAFTARGAALAKSLAQALTRAGHTCQVSLPPRLAGDRESYSSLKAWTEQAFTSCDGLIYVGACGIAVRAVAPHVRDKFLDPAVVAVDETGAFSIPLLSGHVGGGNALAREIAALTGGTAVISTATDLNGLFAVDEWAVRQGLYLTDRVLAKRLSAALLGGEILGFHSDFPVTGALPDRVEYGTGPLGFAVTLDEALAPFSATLRLIPRILHVGVGCRRGVPEERIAGFVDGVLRRNHLSPRGIKDVHTIDLKRDERGLLDFCRTRGLPLVTHTAQELRGAAGDFIPSEFVKNVTGVDNVCERAAALGGGTIAIQKQAEQGVTVAVSIAPFQVQFEH